MVARRQFAMLLFAFACAAAFSTAALFAEDPPAIESAADGEKGGADEAAEPGESEPDSFQVPEGNAEELLKFIDLLRGMRPRGENRKEMIESVKRAQTAMMAAADKILAAKPGDEIRGQAIRAKLEALSRLNQFGQEDAEQQLNKLAKELQQGSDAGLAKQAQSILLQLRARKLMMGDVEGADALLAEITKQLAAAPDDMATVRVALGIAQALEVSGKTEKLAIQAYHDFAAILSKSTNPAVVERAAQIDGVIRRIELPGKPMEITGTQLDGEPFDRAKLNGKVVLVDFWATWCGPCVEELPNVLENYAKYHDKGFEVVGISLDQDRESLEAFIRDREIPWITLFEEDAEAGNPMATRYGVMEIPTVILIGADGNVVSLNARGEKLGELLAKLLGPVDEKPAVGTEKKGDERSSRRPANVSRRGRELGYIAVSHRDPVMKP